MSASKLRLSKIDAALRQLVEAARLFFEGRDPVSIHTLAAAGRQILVDLASKQRIVGLLNDPAYIRPERADEWRRLIVEPENFFKHADRDPAARLEYPTDGAKFLLLDAAILAERLGVPKPRVLGVFCTWIVLKHPDFVDGAAAADWLEPAHATHPPPNDLNSWAEIASRFVG